MSEKSPVTNASDEAGINPIADAKRVIKEQRVVTNGRERSTQVEEATVVLPSAATIERRRYARARRTIYSIANILAIFLFIRFLLILFGADPLNSFARFIYGITFPFALPFRDLFGPGRDPQLGIHGFDASILVAIAIYYLFAWIAALVARLVYLRMRSEPAEAGTIGQ